MQSEWANLKEIIQIKQPAIKDINGSIEYLQEAYEFTEALWERNFQSISDLKVVLLSEAPLYGEKQSYIYNHQTKPTSFFYFNDMVATCEKPKLVFEKFKSTVEKKKYMIETMAKNGLLILDIFPYALKKDCTKISYRSLSKKEYSELLTATIPFYLQRKLVKISKAASSNLKFAYRYKVLKTNTEEQILNQISKEGMLTSGNSIPCINGSNMPLSREKLSNLFHC